MRHLKLFEEFESPLIKTAKDMKFDTEEMLGWLSNWRDQRLKKYPTVTKELDPPTTEYVEEKPETWKMEGMEKKWIIDAIIKNYTLSYQEIAKLLGIDTRTLHRKLEQYDLRDLKRQIRMRKGKGWSHPYNEVGPVEP